MSEHWIETDYIINKPSLICYKGSHYQDLMLVNLMTQKDNVELQINLTISVDNVNNTLICVCYVLFTVTNTINVHEKLNVKCEVTFLSIMQVRQWLVLCKDPLSKFTILQNLIQFCHCLYAVWPIFGFPPHSGASSHVKLWYPILSFQRRFLL